MQNSCSSLWVMKCSIPKGGIAEELGKAPFIFLGTGVEVSQLTELKISLLSGKVLSKVIAV